jgi:hypothetical protein
MNPAMAGLGALTKQGAQPTGKSPETMSQTMALAKQMSDMQLADVLAGKSMNIPQYVAMTEAMGRKQLRTAMQGMTAMGSAKQPTEREKLLSEMMPRQQQPQAPMSAPPQGAGLDQLPADNMQGLADGGIIAFSGKSGKQEVEEPDDFDVNNYQTDRDMGNAMRRRGQSFLGSVGEELGNFGRFIKNPFSSKDPKANYMRELEAQADRAPSEELLDIQRSNEASAFNKAYWDSPEGKKQLIQAQQRGEPNTIPPSKVMNEIYTLREGHPTLGALRAAQHMGLSRYDVERMQAAQENPTAALEEQQRREKENQPRAVMSPSTPVGGRPNNMPLGMSPDMLERLKGQKEQFIETMRGPAPGGNAGSFNLLNPGAVPPSYNPNARPSTPRRMTEAEAAQAEMLRAEAASPMGVAPPSSPAAAAPKTSAVPPKTGGTNTGGGPGGGGPGGGGPGGSGPGGGGPGGGGPGGSLAGTDLSRFAEKQADLLRPKERSKDYYEALTKPTEDIAKQVASGKEQAQGEFLMNIGAALMSTPNLGVALSKGVQAGLPGLAASRKEINALSKDQRDYQFNIAKAKEARDQGDEMLALNYLKLAEESKYHAGMVGAYMARATAGGGSDKLEQQLNIAAARLTQSDWEKHEKTLGTYGAKKVTPEQKQAFMQESYARNRAMMLGNTPPAAAGPKVYDNPGEDSMFRAP